MRNIFLCALAVTMLITVNVFSADSVNIKIKGVRYVTTYTEPVNDDSPAKVDIVFYKIKPSPYKTEQILAANIISSASIQPDKDILGTAWYSSSGDAGDITILPVKDGSFHLAYSAAGKQMISWEQYTKMHDKQSGGK